MSRGVFDPRGAEAYLTVRRAPRGEKTPLGVVPRRPQKKAGEKCGLGLGRLHWRFARGKDANMAFEEGDLRGNGGLEVEPGKGFWEIRVIRKGGSVFAVTQGARRNSVRFEPCGGLLNEL